MPKLKCHKYEVIINVVPVHRNSQFYLSFIHMFINDNFRDRFCYCLSSCLSSLSVFGPILLSVFLFCLWFSVSVRLLSLDSIFLSVFPFHLQFVFMFLPAVCPPALSSCLSFCVMFYYVQPFFCLSVKQD